jgi:GNAT superfamily N-acetyltransferase
LIRYRPFQNCDPPALADIWRSQPPLRGRMQGVTPLLLEELIFARPYFDRNGLIVALDADRPVGFVHAGFGASDDLSTLDKSLGTTCHLLVAPHAQRAQIQAELLRASENYLAASGVRQLFGGGAFPVNPFYLGLYGGSRLPGVLTSDVEQTVLFQNAGYREQERRILLSRPLATFRPPIDRRLMQLRRRCVVTAVHDVTPDNWWESCVWMHANWTRYELRFRDSEDPLISATFWDILPLSKSWGVQAVGIVRVEDTPEARTEGMTTFLLAEAILDLHRGGAALLETQAFAKDASLRALYKELGLAEYDEGVLFVKEQLSTPSS